MIRSSQRTALSPALVSEGALPFKSVAASGLRPKGFLVNTPGNPFFSQVFCLEALRQLDAMLELDPRVVTEETVDGLENELAEAEVLVGTWGFPVPLAKRLACLPKLRLVLYAGGSVKAFARPFLERGIPVVGARKANAVSVAEFCLAQIILSNKGYFRNTRCCRTPATAHQLVADTGPGNYGETVALLGFGAIARHLRKILRQFKLHVLVVDPTIDLSIARENEIQLVDMEEAFSKALVVSNHLPNIPSLGRVITADHFRRMRPGATFINTGRGAQVDEAALIEVLREREDLTALLDVTEPEPPAPDSPLYKLPNVQLSSHISGVIGDERRRLTDLIVTELDRFLKGEPLNHTVRLEDLQLMA